MIPKWLEVALEELQAGVAEVPGVASNPRIDEYLASVGLEAGDPGFDGDETPWCAAFMHWCLREAGITGTARANARSYTKWGDTAEEPALGSVAVLWRGSRSGWQGHVAFVMDVSSSSLYLLGGNQGNRVSISPYLKDRVLGYRRPFQE